MIEKVTLEMNSQQKFNLSDGTDCRTLNPKAMLLFAAAKCAALTLHHILSKEHIDPKRIEISVLGDMTTDTVHAETIFRSFNVVYNVECDLYEEQAKVSHAINLTHEKYCGLVQMLRRIAPVTHEIAIVSTQPAKD